MHMKYSLYEFESNKHRKSKPNSFGEQAFKEELLQGFLMIFTKKKNIISKFGCVFYEAVLQLEEFIRNFLEEYNNPFLVKKVAKVYHKERLDLTLVIVET